MAKLTIIVGMAGSGKSSLCDSIENERSVVVFKDATLTKCDRRRAGHDCLGEMVARLLGGDQDCVMDEAHLTNSYFRDAFKEFCDGFLKDVEQEWVFFESDALACINNVSHDAKKKGRAELTRLRSLANQIDHYIVPSLGEFPGHAEPRPVYRQPNPCFQDEAAARSWLRAEIERLDAEQRLPADNATRCR